MERERCHLFLLVLNVHFHCAGHSLGSQVCGYAGKYTQSEFGWKMDRITGLDPAGPAFEGTDVAVRIDKSGKIELSCFIAK